MKKTSPVLGKDQTHLAAYVALISPRNDDVPFALGLSEGLGCNFYHFRSDWKGISSLLSRSSKNTPRGIVLWDVDHPNADGSDHAFFVGAIAPVLARHSDPVRTVAISDQLASKLKYLTNQEHRIFIPNILRRKSATANEIYGRLVVAALQDQVPEMGLFFERSQSKKEQIQLRETSHRAATLVAMKNFLEKNGLAERLSHQAAEAADELLLNAIFDAPTDPHGKRYRKGQERSEVFKFEPRERVTLTIMSNRLFFGIGVRDQFGSLDVGQLIPSLYSNYQVQGYRPDSTTAGLGLNKVLESGFSLFLATEAGKTTEAMLFFPRAKNHAEFKSAFRFLSAVWHA